MSSNPESRTWEIAALISVSAGVALITIGHAGLGGLLLVFTLFAAVNAMKHNSKMW